ncbi:MAG: RecQ family ATP-dependent DNA helicase [Bacteroidota bacterium]
MESETNILPEGLLRKYWGYDQFRYPQKEIIQSVLDNKDTLALLPTGGGKSICFQIPALAKEGICIVISPLIALMKDQVEQLSKRGIKASAIFSGMTKRQIDITLDNCIYGDHKFLYVSPERLKTDLFKERSKKMNINLIAIDEAHCISQWGYDFRPAYLEIRGFTETLADVPQIALTASATPRVEQDILEKLELSDTSTFRKSFARENLTYSVFELENKESKLLDILNKVPGSAIVYVRSRNKTKTISEFLNKNRISSAYYHGGLGYDERNRKQELWISSKFRVMVATNAFGMGIDKPNVRSVVHLDIPPDIESYYQEAGRGGRDGHRAYAVMLYHQSDIDDLKNKIEQSNPSIEEVKPVYQSISNYLKIAVGSAFMASYDINLDDLVKNFKLEKKSVFYRIKALQTMGLIELNESFFTNSQITFLVKNEDVYRFEIEHKEFEGILKCILRLYGGEVYQSYVNIQESDVSRLLKISVSEVCKKLRKLKEFSILDYQEKSDLPKITFLTPRLNANDLEKESSILKERRTVNLEKADPLIKYLKTDSVCRTRQLVSYFGEEMKIDCGYCDYCLKNRSTYNEEVSKIVGETLLNTLEEGPFTLERIYLTLRSFKKDMINSVIRVLLDQGKIRYKENDIIEKVD